VDFFFGLDTVVLTEGSILGDLGIISVTIMGGRGATNYRVAKGGLLLIYVTYSEFSWFCKIRPAPLFFFLVNLLNDSIHNPKYEIEWLDSIR
jgi:hypothetical protein